jgi:hypothetical protein
MQKINTSTREIAAPAHWRDAISRIDVLISTSSKQECQDVLRWCESVYRDRAVDDSTRAHHFDIAQLLRRRIKGV